MALSDIKKWQDAFINYSVPEIFQLNTQLRTHVTTKKQELRDLVGNRYRDMLKTADIILEMNDLVGKEDESLSELCTSHRYSAWATHGQNVKKFLKFSERVDAVEGLLIRVVSFVKRHGRTIRKNQHYLLVARSIWLAHVLLDNLNGSITTLDTRKLQQLKADVDQVEAAFSKTIECLLLKGEATESIISYNNLFFAYCILNKMSTAEALQSMLAARLKFITHQSELLENPEVVFPRTLQHISNVYRIVKAGYKKNALTRQIYQQTEVFSLLDSPEFVNQAELRIEKFKSHLPSDIQSLRAFPAACSDDIINSGRGSSKTSTFITNSLKDFGQKISKVLNDNLPSMLNKIDDLHRMVELYREVLMLVQDTESLRKLSLDGESGEDDETFYRSVFWPLWTKRFNEIVETEINKLLNTENKLFSIHGNLVEQKNNVETAPASSDFIFGKNFLSDFSNAKGTDYANILIQSLSSFANGSVGDVKPISDEYKLWIKSVSTIQSHVEEVSKMKALLSGNYLSSTSDEIDNDGKRAAVNDFSDDGDEDDYESAEFWRRTEKKLISTNHSVFSQHITKSLTNVHSEMLAKIVAVSKTNKTDNLRAFVLVLRAVMLLDSHFQNLDTTLDATASETFVMSVYERLSDTIAKDLDAIDLDLYKEEEGENGPSLYILEYVAKLVKHLTDVFGDDELLWNNAKFTNILRERVGSGIIKELTRIDKAWNEKTELVSKDKESLQDSVNSNNKTDTERTEESFVQESDSKDESKRKDDTADETSTETNDQDAGLEPVTEPEVPESLATESSVEKEEPKPFSRAVVDYKYISLLLGVTDPYLSDATATVVEEKTLVDIVKRTRILYLPLAL